MLLNVKTSLMTHIFTFATLQQLILVLGIMAAASSLAEKLAIWVGAKMAQLRARGIEISLIASRIYLTSRDIIFLLLSPLLLWIFVAVADAADWPLAIP